MNLGNDNWLLPLAVLFFIAFVLAMWTLWRDRRDLKNAVPPGGVLEGPLLSGSLEGGVDANNGIQIYTTTGLITPNSPWGEIQKVTYGLQAPTDSSSTNNGKDLVRVVAGDGL